MGAIKVALGDAGKDLASLAAADYFFRNRYRRAYFKHFTNLVPMERSGSIRKSMDTANEVLRARAQHGGVPRGDALGDRRDGRVSPQPRLPGAARRGRDPAGAHRAAASRRSRRGRRCRGRAS